jgi:hypothetical protein
MNNEHWLFVALLLANLDRLEAGGSTDEMWKAKDLYDRAVAEFEAVYGSGSWDEEKVWAFLDSDPSWSDVLDDMFST